MTFKIKNLFSPLFLLYLLLVFPFFLSSVFAENALRDIKKRGYILWGGDAEGGAPYVFPDPKEPSKLIGFEVDLAVAIAEELGVKEKFYQNDWDNLVPALNRKNFDIILNGLEITPLRKNSISFTMPYYIYSEQLMVRKDEKNIKSINDIAGKRVGTLQASVAMEILAGLKGVQIVNYKGVVEPYHDLVNGRIDAVFLDLPMAAFYGKPNPRLKYAGEPVGEGYYAIGVRKDERELLQELNRAINNLITTGKLKSIYEEWGLWNRGQEKLAVIKDESEAGGFNKSIRAGSLKKYLPILLKGAGITIVISFLSMFLAITLGMVICFLRLYAGKVSRFLATAYVEIVRGTPLLIQLYLIYYGLPNIGIRLDAFTAAVLGLGINYAAYEAEIYRAGLQSIPKVQTEAALSLGMSKRLAIRRIIAPQAVRVVIPPVTNDFIALFKDSSLVSIITVVELTKSYSILAISSLRFLELGILTAILYFSMSYPLSLFARYMEKRIKHGD